MTACAASWPIAVRASAVAEPRCGASSAFGAATQPRLAATYHVDLTKVGMAELARRIAHEKEQAGAA